MPRTNTSHQRQGLASVFCAASVVFVSSATAATVTINFENPSQYIGRDCLESGFSFGPVELFGPGEDTLPPSIPIPQTSTFAGTLSTVAVLSAPNGQLFTLTSIDVAPQYDPASVHGYSLLFAYFSSLSSSSSYTLYAADYPGGFGWSTLTLPNVKAAKIELLELECGIGCGGDPAYIDNLVITSDEGPAPVPETSTWLLLTIGAGAIGSILRNRREVLRPA